MTRADVVSTLINNVSYCSNRMQGQQVSQSRPNGFGNVSTEVLSHDALTCKNCAGYLAQFIVDMLHVAAQERLTQGNTNGGR